MHRLLLLCLVRELALSDLMRCPLSLSLSSECTNVHNFACMLKLSILHELRVLYHNVWVWPCRMDKKIFSSMDIFCVFLFFKKLFFLQKRYVYVQWRSMPTNWKCKEPIIKPPYHHRRTKDQGYSFLLYFLLRKI